MSQLGRIDTLRIAVGLAVVVSLVVGLFGVWYPYTLEPFEGAVLVPALRISSGNTTYGPAALMDPPHIWAAYGPLFYVFTGAAMRIVGVAFWPGRLLSLLGTIGTGMMIFRMVRKTESEGAGLVALGVFVALPVTASYGALSRVDSLGIFFATACVALAAPPEQEKRRVFLAGGAAAAAFLTKPTILAAAAAVAITFLIGKNRSIRSFVAYAAGASVAFASMALMLHASGNDAYWSAQLGNAKVPFSIGKTVAVTRTFLDSHIVWVAIIFSIVGLPLARGTSSTRLTMRFLMLAFTLAVLTAAKQGSGLNYFYETGVALSLAAGLATGSIESSLTFGLGGITLVRAFTALSIGAQFLLYYPSILQGRVFLPLNKRAFYADTVRLLEGLPQGATVGGEYPELALFAHREVVQNDSAMFALGPPPVRKIFDQSVDERSVDAWIFAEPYTLPGYEAVNRPFVNPSSFSGNYYPGPLVYLRVASLPSHPIKTSAEDGNQIK